MPLPFDPFGAAIWDPVAARFEQLEDALREHIRDAVPGTQSFPHRYSGGTMALQVYLRFRPADAEAVETMVKVTFWFGGSFVRPEVVLIDGVDDLDRAERPDVGLAGTAAELAQRLEPAVDDLVDWIWLRRDVVAQSVARAAGER